MMRGKRARWLRHWLIANYGATKAAQVYRRAKRIWKQEKRLPSIDEIEPRERWFVLRCENYWSQDVYTMCLSHLRG